MKAFEKIKKLVADMEANVNLVDGGKKSATTDVRKDAMKLKEAAQELREECLEVRKKK